MGESDGRRSGPIANPIAAPPVDSLVQVKRNVFCSNYNECLETAIIKDWDNFSCTACRFLDGSRQLGDEWLSENTFRCALGRLTPRQCGLNRSRKRIKEPRSLHDRDAKENGGRVLGIARPSACETCKDWKRLIAEFRDKAKIEGDGMEERGVGTSHPVESPAALGTCKQCKAQFEPYRRGAVVVKTICPACLTLKTAPKREAGNAQVAGKTGATGIGELKSDVIAISFTDADAELLARIREISSRERRSPDAQILHWIETLVPELSAQF